MAKKIFKTFLEDGDSAYAINDSIEKWIETIGGTEVDRSAPSLVIADVYNKGLFHIAVTVTAEVPEE